MPATRTCSACGGELKSDGACGQCGERVASDAGEAKPSIPGAEASERPASTMRLELPTGRPGENIGPYKLLHLIGEGGFGVVYLAEQQAPVRRCVASKVIKLVMDIGHEFARV